MDEEIRGVRGGGGLEEWSNPGFVLRSNPIRKTNVCTS